MRERRELWLGFFRSCIPLILVFTGVACFFIFPEQGFNMLGSSLLIAFSYFTILRRQQGQLVEFIVLLSILAVTGYAYAYPESLGGLLFIPQVLYLLCQIGRLFIFKELKNTYRYFKRRWLEKWGCLK